MNSNFTSLAACDIDWTLMVGSVISDANRIAVDKLTSRRKMVTLATGRNFHHIVGLYQGLGLVSPTVTSDGALVSFPGGEILSERPLPQDVTAKILAMAADWKITCLCFYKQGIFMTSQGDWHEGMERHRELGCRFRHGGVNVMSRKPVYKPLLFSLTPALLDEFQSVVLESYGDAVDAIRNSRNSLEFVAKGVSKVSGLTVVCNHFGFDPADAFAFGDGVNDVGMFGWAGLSMCMHHGHDDAKRAATAVAPATAAEVNFAAAVDAAFELDASIRNRSLGEIATVDGAQKPSAF